MVEGASLLLFCHDDVAPDPDAVHILVEESFRSNAGVVAPKLVSWDDPTRLLHVGMAVDKGGAVVDRMEPGEIDHGQHDAVRDVFLAPGGCTLVRFDLFAELGGFDPEIFAMGEDLDLCWRAQIVGARVVVAPGARVRHLEMLASGRRSLPDHLDDPGSGSDAISFMLETWSGSATDRHVRLPTDGLPTRSRTVADTDTDSEARSATDTARPDRRGRARAMRTRGRHRRGDGDRRCRTRRWTGATAPSGAPRRTAAVRVTLQSLQRRHELHAVLKAYGPFHLARVLPQVALLPLAEYVVAVVARHRDRASAVAPRLAWNFATRRSSARGAGHGAGPSTPRRHHGAKAAAARQRAAQRVCATSGHPRPARLPTSVGREATRAARSRSVRVRRARARCCAERRRAR